jgi:hypothetical protein
MSESFLDRGDGVCGNHRARSLSFDRLVGQTLCCLHQDALDLLRRERWVRFDMKL